MRDHTRREQGFTLIELMIAIVVVGVLTAVAIVSIGGLLDSPKESACVATRDAAESASATFYANAPNATTYPTTFDDLVPPDGVLDVPSGATRPPESDTVLEGAGRKWVLTMTPGGPLAEASFVCTYPAS